jgi:hypothetical protein
MPVRTKPTAEVISIAKAHLQHAVHEYEAATYNPISHENRIGIAFDLIDALNAWNDENVELLLRAFYIVRACKEQDAGKSLDVQFTSIEKNLERMGKKKIAGKRGGAR